MRVVVKTNHLTREEWLKYRTHRLGGSDVSSIAGINPFKSAHQIWLEKTGQIEPEQAESEYAYFGTLLEPIVRREFTARTGIKVRQKHMLLQSEKHPFMFADLDGVINDGGEIVIFEAKTASQYKLDIWKNGVPAEYILQVQHYMAVTGAKKTYVAALVGGNHFIYHEVKRDEILIAKIIAMEKYFWETYVIGGAEPIPDGTEATTNYFNCKFRESSGRTVELPEEVLVVCEEDEKVSQQLKQLETAKNAAANQLKSYLKDAEVGRVGDYKITWKQVYKNSLDQKRLKEEQPDIYEGYIVQNSYRRLSVA